MEAEHEAKRGLELRISNAQFSKLIKMGRDKGLTPQRMCQALFEEAYEAACMGKGRAAGASEAEAAHDDFRKLAQLAEEWKAKAEKTEGEAGEWKARHDLAIVKLCQADKDLDKARQTIAGKDTMLLDQARQIREADAEIQQLRQRLAEESGAPQTGLIDPVALFQAAVKHGPIEIVAVAAEPAIEPPLAPGEEHPKIFQLKRLIRARHACGLSAREIAKELELPIGAVRQVLG